MGKISRFGLMELSRQRLRPALSEGSHITCPRCNGVGVIRDTESSALHILRIIQEEAMKENTAAIHAQVPVDAATYLLNEKRADIAKLEARMRVSIVLIPNKHLETPHYKVERLRHDDERLDLAKASYERAESPTIDTPYAAAAAAAEKAKAKQEAVVRGIVHETPAPVAAPPPTAAPAPAPIPAAAPLPQPSFFARLWNSIIGRVEPAPTAPAPAPVAATPEAKPQRPERPERPADRGRDRRGGRGGRGERGERGDRRERQGVEAREGGQAGAPQEGRRPLSTETAAAAKERTDRGDRRERERPARPPRDKEAEAGVAAAAEVPPTPTPSPVSALTTESLVPGAEGAAAAEKRRRGRRRRGRGGRGEAEGQEAAAAVETAVASAGEEVPAMPDREARVPPAMPEHEVRMPPVQPIAEAAAPEAAPIPEPLRAATPIILPPAVAPAPMPVEALRPVLEQAGLTLVQTEPQKLADVLARFAAEATPPRVPRERPVLPPLDAGPLIQVETRRPAAPSQP